MTTRQEGAERRAAIDRPCLVQCPNRLGAIADQSRHGYGGVRLILPSSPEQTAGYSPAAATLPWWTKQEFHAEGHVRQSDMAERQIRMSEESCVHRRTFAACLCRKRRTVTLYANRRIPPRTVSLWHPDQTAASIANRYLESPYSTSNSVCTLVWHDTSPR